MPPEACDSDELSILVEQRCERVCVSGIPRPDEERRDLIGASRDRMLLPACIDSGWLQVRGEPLPRPSAIETHELCPMSVQNVRGAYSLLTVLGEHHDYESAGTDVFEVMQQMFVFLDRAGGSNQRALKLRKKTVVGAFRVQSLRTFLTVHDVDILPIEAGLQERIDGRVSVVHIGNRTDDAIGRVRNEIWPLGRACFHDSPPWGGSLAKAGRQEPRRPCR